MSSKIDLVSVLVPVYNHSRYVIECLDSILNQTYKNIEIVIINDGSRDDSDAIVCQWIIDNPEARVVYETQENRGVTKTLNRLLELSSGDYIALCASDDKLTMDSIEKRLNFLYLHPQHMACIGDADVIDADSVFSKQKAMVSLYGANYKNLQRNIKRELVLNWSVVGPTMLANRKVYELVGNYDESLLIEDRDFYLRLLARDLLVFMPEIVAYYRIHTDNVSRKTKLAKWNIYNQVAVSNIKNASFFSGVERIFILSHFFDIALTGKHFSIFFYYVLNLYRVLRRLVFFPFRSFYN